MTGAYSEGGAGAADSFDEQWHAPDDPAAIRAEINQTRDRISHDLDEIGERLNPQHVKEEIKDGIREATIGRVEEMARHAGERLDNASGGLVGAIRENPIPAAMAGIGLAWLFMSRNDRSRRMGPGSSYRAGSADSSREQHSGISDAASTVKETVSGIGDQAQHVISKATDTQRLENTYYESPLAIAAGAVALGLAVGLTAPSTRSEQRLMSDIGPQLTEKVSEVARETTEKAQHVAQRAIEETKNAAREEGLTTSSTPGA